MRLSRLDLTRYGRFTDFSLDFGERQAGQPDLHLVYGPNEAGKSTAFAGFLDLLFGIEARSRYDFLHPYAAMQIGAALAFDGATHELVRVKRNQNSLLGPGGQPVPEATLKSALGGIDRENYRTMFSLDDETLERGGESILQSRGDLGQLLFSASAGLADLSRTLSALQAEADSFYRFRAHRTELTQLKAKLAELKESRERIDTQAAAYAQMVAARETSLAAYREAADALGTSRARFETLNRLLAAHGPWLRRLSLDREIAAIGPLPEPPAHWPDDIAALQREEIELETLRSASAAALDRLDREIAAVPLDALALGLGSRFKQVGGLAARHIKAEQDLPGERAELAAVERTIAALLRRMEREGDDPAALSLPAALAARLRALIAQSAVVAAEAGTARREAEAAAQRLAEAQATRPLSDAEAGIGPLKAALAAWRGSDAPARLRVAFAARNAAADALHERLLQLAPWTGEAEALAALALPPASSFEAWRVRLGEAEARVGGAEAERARLAGEAVRLQAELDAGRSAGLADEAEIEGTRSERERAWAAHRAALDTASAATFEAALRADDRLTAARLERSGETARRNEALRMLALARAAAARAEREATAAGDSLSALREEIAGALAQAVPELPAAWPLDAWQAWIARRERALEAWSAQRGAARDVRAAEDDIAAAAGTLLGALAAAGAMLAAGAGVEAAVAAAEALLEKEAEFRAARAEIEARRREAALRDAQREAAQGKEEAWRGAWREACASCWFGAEASPDGSRAVLDALAELAPAMDKRAGLQVRVRRLEEDCAAFARETETLGLLLGVKRDADPLATFEAVAARIRAAETAAEARALKTREREHAAREDQALSGRVALHSRRAAEITAFFGAGSLGEAGRMLEKAARRRALEAGRSAADAEVFRALGHTDGAAAQDELAALDPAALQAELAELAVRLETEEERARQRYAEHVKAADRVEAVGGDDAVARIEESRRTVLLEIEERALGHLRLKIGIAAAEAGLRAYRDHHRSSMMERASEAFRTVSRGAYSRLGVQPGKDGDVLVAVAADGASKLAESLSKGTRFQLYLALRAAGYAEFARARAPVPFVADDIMETFDDFRAEEAFRLFTEMAGMGQVIYLTHHRHLCDIAREVCPGVAVHELPAPG